MNVVQRIDEPYVVIVYHPIPPANNYSRLVLKFLEWVSKKFVNDERFIIDASVGFSVSFDSEYE